MLYPPRMSTLRALLERHLTAGDPEAALDVLAPKLPGMPGNATRKAYLSSARVYLRWAQEQDVGVLRARPQDARAYLGSLAAAGSSESTLHNHATRVRTLYDLLAELGAHPGPNPFDGLSLPSQKPEEHRLMYTGEEIERLLAHSDAMERALVLLGSRPGLTTSETLNLQWEAVDTRRGELHVRGKVLPLDDELYQALREYGRERGHTDLFEARGPVFDVQGDYGLRRVLFRLCSRANVPYKAWRALRNAAGWHLLQQTGRPEDVAEHLGLGTLKAVEVWQKLQKKALETAPDGA
ncbi:hypothetical protein GCM10017782_25800 [Deinococcus ficus]|nr:hypothetical protein GCM10017782_25800 [Deinococcus ficus]